MNQQAKRTSKTPSAHKKQLGAAAIEYAIIAGLIAVAFIGVASTTGDDIEAVFTEINTELEAIVPAPASP